ncbi:MAG TPA: GNAT family N-acetyltransferase [Candidatus Binatia bacterium]|jgi:CelD/BcsL family acetyltransferase involved in cellulose biosynthesis
MHAQTEIVEDASSFETLREEWSRLLETSASDCVFLTWEWLFTWWKHFFQGRKLSILALREGPELIALAPFASSPPGLRFFSPFRSLEFLGAGSIGSDYLDVILKRGKEEPALAALAEELAHEKRALKLDHLNRRSSSAAELAQRLKKLGWSLYEARRSVSPYIELAGHSWESYLAGLGPEHRYNVRRRMKNLSKQFDVRFEAAGTEEERREAFSLLVELHGMRWRQNGVGGVFRAPGLLSFHEEMSRLALERGWLRLFVLRLDGKPAAALYGFRYKGVFYFYQSGFDPAYGKFSVGLVTMGLAIKNAIEEGASEYDFLYGDEPYKFLWARRARELGCLEMYPPSMAGRVYKQAVDLNRAARKMARQVLAQPLSGLR